MDFGHSKLWYGVLAVAVVAVVVPIWLVVWHGVLAVAAVAAASLW